MYLKRRRFARERLKRVRQRAQSATRRIATALIELPRRDAVRHNYVPAGASRTCGTEVEWIDTPHGRRRSERVPVAAQISVRRCGGFPFELPLADVCIRGCKVELVEGAEAQERVIARFPGLEPFGATIAWTEGRSAGLSFDKAMHPAVFEHLLSRIA